jgi:20S proteasome subunit alpha 1
VALVTQARAEASEYRYNYGYAMPCRVLAMRMADLAQVYTQHAGRRAYAGMMILCSNDDEAGPQLYKVDPAGHFFGFKAVAAGPKYLESTTRLEKCIKENGNENDTVTTIRNVIMELQAVLSTDFKKEEIEVAYIEGDAKFRTLTEQEIDDHLTAIAERD